MELSNLEDVITKAYLDTDFSKVEGHISYIEKDHIDFRDVERSKRQCDEGFLVEKAVETTIQILCDRGFFDNYENASEE